MIVALPLLALAAAQKDCPDDSTARYEVIFTGLWSEETFPKVYPTLRPSAEWSPLIGENTIYYEYIYHIAAFHLLGRTHADSYSLFKVNETASPAMKSFAESTVTLHLNEEGQGNMDILDAFSTASLDEGVGSASAMFFADSLHAKVSAAVMRMYQTNVQLMLLLKTIVHILSVMQQQGLVELCVNCL